MSEAAINGDLTQRAVLHGADMPWQPSPSGTVWRKRFHRVGPAESGQVTSLVRYQPASRFPAHDHPEGEEILVLDGVFSDQHGDFPAGSYLLNPEGFSHAPFSREGCLLFVKLRQYPGRERSHLTLQTRDLAWAPHPDGRQLKRLFVDPRFPERMQLERWPRGVRPVADYPGGAEIFVLQGAFEDADSRYQQHSWLRLPPGTGHQPRTREGCQVYVKSGGVTLLRSAALPSGKTSG